MDDWSKLVGLAKFCILPEGRGWLSSSGCSSEVVGNEINFRLEDSTGDRDQRAKWMDRQTDGKTK
jgi:hypothetical protein